ncbi:MAG: hypothetical protein JSU65_14460 [Candidatus Zixiibacteriota bacterium]|nr:MAG: hypothetical protein JSU65_14460 [candidate division Zixibacteria bacterium]
MAPKRATFYSYGEEERCQAIRKFLEDAGVILDIRDIEKDPLTVGELDKLLGHGNMANFLNKLSERYVQAGLDKRMPERDELLKMIAEDNDLLRRPIVTTQRLKTVGCDKKKIKEMLQLDRAAHAESMDPENSIGNRPDHRAKQSRGRRRTSVVSAGK